MKNINYMFKAFGFDNPHDFSSTVFKLLYVEKSPILLFLTAVLGTFRSFCQDLFGLDAVVYAAFIILIAAEIQTGIKVSKQNKNERVKSRKVGRTILKLGVYTNILFVLWTFASRIEVPELLGFEVNPFKWLYWTVFGGIVFQLVISYLENLSALGYAEARGILGIILRKGNQWFEFDGSKNPDKDHE